MCEWFVFRTFHFTTLVIIYTLLRSGFYVNVRILKWTEFTPGVQSFTSLGGAVVILPSASLSILGSLRR